ncbi:MULTISPECIES: hypothetical protein [unclassified Pseudomonas]|uniref:hypothetical protein n=1 Tax=unclassified Pseudomonas TaxID=196821 RepID=UPI00257ED082|nr:MULTISPECIES: hypothetical protein [unclassified Pseudomonas]
MPTENRSSNTEMVSVQRERLDALWREIQDSSLRSEDPPHVRFAAALLAHPAEEHQVKPVALPSCNAKLSDSHDWDQGYRGGWRACLDEISKLGPLYTHADHCEVERLRADLAQCEAMAAMVAEREWAEHVGTGLVSSKVEAAFSQLHIDLHGANEKLAGRDALLREAYAELLAIKAEIGFRGATIALIGRIDATLSASAEPEAKS